MTDCVIVGGGLAGLSSAILLAEQEFSVILFEKKKYPFHKVCGEYIARESHPFIESLGIDLDEMNLPEINHLLISSLSGHTLEYGLSPGGIGISRFKLDYLLMKRARELGVDVRDNTNVLDITGKPNAFIIKTPLQEVLARVVIGSFGKRSNLDTSLKRRHQSQEIKKSIYIAVKYHIKTDIPTNHIELHNFKDGYCGLSMIEEGKTCLCYLTTAENLKASGDIRDMEKNILSQNPFLKQYLSNSRYDFYKTPLTISNIFFKDKTLIEKGVIMMGDAARLITPLCGNGMSMAFHSAAMLGGILPFYLRGKITFPEFACRYERIWRQAFNTRLRAGMIFQRFFGRPIVTNLFIRFLSQSSFMKKKLIQMTHGMAFKRSYYESL